MAAAVLTVPGSAVGGPPASAPPANSAVNQYTETFPSAGGPKISNAVRDGERRSPRQALGAENAKRLQERGPAGRAAAMLAAATTPRGQSGRPGDATAAPASGTAAIAGQALGTTSSSKLGLALPLIIFATLAWAVSYALRRKPRPA
jgi:hypothetical protein